MDFGIEILRCSPTPYSSPRKNLCGERQFCVNKGRILAQSKFLIRSPTRLTLMDFTRQKTLEYPFNCAVNMRMTNTREASDKNYYPTFPLPHRLCLWGREMEGAFCLKICKNFRCMPSPQPLSRKAGERFGGFWNRNFKM